MPSVEVVANSTKAEKPGWAYVADTGYDPTKAPVPQLTNRKRKARVQDISEAGLTARQSTALAKRLAELEKDNSRDLVIPVPTGPDGKRNKPKNPTTKRILESQKGFAHCLADEEAFLARDNEAQAQVKSRAGGRKSTAMLPPSLNKAGTVTESGNDGAQNGSSKPSVSKPQTLDEAEARLMQIVVPAAPSQRLMEALTSAPPLSWNEARAKPSSSGKPQRHFCEICGYWGRVKCLQCGARVCALPCKRTHDDGRCLRYGA